MRGLPTHFDSDVCLLTSTVLKENFFLFNNSFYGSISRGTMGSNLSPLLAEFLMDHLESSVLIILQFYLKLIFTADM